jgi:hypothetical protein
VTSFFFSVWFFIGKFDCYYSHKRRVESQIVDAVSEHEDQGVVADSLKK